jgi:hypothetical protein
MTERRCWSKHDVMADCFTASSWVGENGFVQVRNWIAGAGRQLSGIASFGPEGVEISLGTPLKGERQ